MEVLLPLNKYINRIIIKGVTGNKWEVMNMFMALIAVMVSHVYTYPQTRGAAYLKYVQISTSQSYLNTFFF